MQLPLFSEKKYKNLKKGFPKEFSNQQKFLELTTDEHKRILLTEFTSDETDDILKALVMIPRYKLTCKAYTEGFVDICKNDLVNILVEVERPCQGKDLGITHSNCIENEEGETVYIFFLSKQEDIVKISKMNITGENNEMTLPFPVMQVGTHELIVRLVSFNFTGVDVSEKLTFTSLKESQRRNKQIEEVQKREPERIEPGYIQHNFLGVLNQQDDAIDSEEDIDSDEEQNQVINGEHKEEKNETDKKED